MNAPFPNTHAHSPTTHSSSTRLTYWQKSTFSLILSHTLPGQICLYLAFLCHLVTLLLHSLFCLFFYCSIHTGLFLFVPQTLQAYISLRAFALHVFSVWGALHSALRGWLLSVQILTHKSSTPRGLPWCPIGAVFHHTSSQCPAYVLHAITAA